MCIRDSIKTNNNKTINGTLEEQSRKEITRVELSPEVEETIKIPLTVKGTGITIHGLLDTGASMCVVQRNVLERLQLLDDIQPATPIALTDANGNKYRCDEAIPLPLDIKIANIKFAATIQCYVSDTVKREIYLGLPFVKKYEHLINFKELCNRKRKPNEKQESTESMESIESTKTEIKAVKNESREPIEAKAVKSESREPIEAKAVKIEPKEPSDKGIIQGTRVNAEQELIKPICELVNATRFERDINSAEVLGTISIAELLPEHSIDTVEADVKINKAEAEEDRIFKEFPECITNDEPSGLPPNRITDHAIETLPGTPSVYRPQYRLSISERQALSLIHI